VNIAMAAIVADTPNVAAALIDALIASNRGDRRAFEFARKTYSYQDVAALMNRTGNMIRDLGVAAQGRVLLLLPESPAFVASLLGVMKAGAVPVVGAPLDDADALAHCIAAVAPAAVIVHQTYLEPAARSLAAIPHDAVVVVGTNGDGYKSFVDAVRTQPSWLSAAAVHGDDPALGLWNGAALVTISHAGISAFINADGDIDGAPSPSQARLAAMLRAFSNGEEAQLQ
jgi:acyl-coenzyme A synthetase/AMP-(fatty) acid ligase